MPPRRAADIKTGEISGKESRQLWPVPEAHYSLMLRNRQEAGRAASVHNRAGILLASNGEQAPRPRANENHLAICLRPHKLRIVRFPEASGKSHLRFWRSYGVRDLRSKKVCGRDSGMAAGTSAIRWSCGESLKMERM